MAKTLHHLVRAPHRHLADASVRADLRKLIAGVKGINAKIAIIVPAILGSMEFFWFANVLAFTSLPAVLTAFDSEVLKGVLGLAGFFPSVIIKVSLIALVAWLAQTYIQLVALPVLQVSNNAQMAQQEHNTKIILTDGAATRDHTEQILDTLSLETRGGLRDVRDDVLKAVRALGRQIRDDPPAKPPGPPPTT